MEDKCRGDEAVRDDREAASAYVELLFTIKVSHKGNVLFVEAALHSRLDVSVMRTDSELLTEAKLQASQTVMLLYLHLRPPSFSGLPLSVTRRAWPNFLVSHLDKRARSLIVLLRLIHGHDQI